MNFRDHLSALARGNYGTGPVAKPLRTTPFGPDPVEIYSEETFAPTQSAGRFDATFADPSQSPTSLLPPQTPSENPAPRPFPMTSQPQVTSPSASPAHDAGDILSQTIFQSEPDRRAEAASGSTPANHPIMQATAPQPDLSLARKLPDVLGYDPVPQVQRSDWAQDITTDLAPPDGSARHLPRDTSHSFNFEQADTDPVPNATPPANATKVRTPSVQAPPTGLSIGELNIVMLPPDSSAAPTAAPQLRRGIPISPSAARRRAGIGRL
ncbi:hypothetical protein [Falsihalocynthiibacter arcticus]|uniref:Uncharacterized protein n=1 Tax=Falsihalocynthiibacter arcticus TaxID=1579316 RepID=A0A126V0R3_9RHOB|nr:hypothetical protein [Falsihalocynthiibacter arcticus]AML51928.1 hypothetical protein RC74_12210 [Falsihalocynthiibacter arcticus]